LQPSGFQTIARAPHQQRHVGALPAAVGVQLVENQEAKPARRFNQTPLMRPSQDQFQHDVVRQQDVGWASNDRVLFVVRFLPSVASEGCRSLPVGVTVSKELL